MRGWGPSIGSFFSNTLDKCQGKIIFTAKLSKVYYSIAMLWFTSILAEVAALVIMVRQVVMVARNKTDSESMAVG
jgi:hypothetical protein